VGLEGGLATGLALPLETTYMVGAYNGMYKTLASFSLHPTTVLKCLRG
jgi:hypothetical protein